MSYAVNEAFERLYNDGLIYRDTRLINWCPHLQTVISDIEVDYLEIDKPVSVPLPSGKK